MHMRDWFLAFHLIGVAVYAGSMLTISLALVLAARRPADDQRRVLPLLRKLYGALAHPAMGLLLVFGLLLFFRVGTDGSALDYLRPYHDGHVVRTYWYSTFHAKLVLFAVLLISDILMFRKLARACVSGEVRSGRPFAIAHIVGLATIALIVVLMEAGPLKGPFINDILGAPTDPTDLAGQP